MRTRRQTVQQKSSLVLSVQGQKLTTGQQPEDTEGNGRTEGGVFYVLLNMLGLKYLDSVQVRICIILTVECQ